MYPTPSSGRSRGQSSTDRTRGVKVRSRALSHPDVRHSNRVKAPTARGGISTQQEFLARMEQLYARNVSISRAKNSDYATTADPFANFKVCEALGIPAEVGIVVRLSDKLARVSNLIQPGRVAQVVDESILDTLSDLANYSMILRMLIETRS